MAPEIGAVTVGAAVAQTDRLLLRRMTVHDASFMLALLNDPSFHEFIGDRGVRTISDAEAYVRDGPLASYATHGFGLYLVTLRSDGTPIGICGLIRRAGLDDADLGFAYQPAFWGHGYAAEAARAVLRHARDDAELPRVAAIVSPNNVRSIRLLTQLGLQFVREMQLTPDASPVLLYIGEL